MGIDEVVTAPRSQWQNPFVERVIGSVRRECLDHVIVWNERSLHGHLRRYVAYYHGWRPHLSLDKDAKLTFLIDAGIRSIPTTGYTNS